MTPTQPDKTEGGLTPLEHLLLSALKKEIRNCPMCRGVGKTINSFDHIIGKVPESEPTECPRCATSRAIVAKAEGRT